MPFPVQQSISLMRTPLSIQQSRSTCTADVQRNSSLSGKPFRSVNGSALVQPKWVHFFSRPWPVAFLRLIANSSTKLERLTRACKSGAAKTWSYLLGCVIMFHFPLYKKYDFRFGCAVAVWKCLAAPESAMYSERKLHTNFPGDHLTQ